MGYLFGVEEEAVGEGDEDEDDGEVEFEFFVFVFVGEFGVGIRLWDSLKCWWRLFSFSFKERGFCFGYIFVGGMELVRGSSF